MLTVHPAPPYRMTSAPLTQALAQVNFPIVPGLETLAGIAPIQERLAGTLPNMRQQQIQQVELLVGPAGPASASSHSATVYVFTDDDAGWSLQITAQSATLSTDGERYRGVDDFRSRLRIVWEVLRDVAGVRRCDRLGVGYVNIVELDGDEWAEWFQPELIGLAHPRLSGQRLVSTLTETRLRAELEGPGSGQVEQVEGVIRHGVVPPGSLMQGIPPRPIQQRSFVLDADTFAAVPGPFDPVRLAVQFDSLHSQIEGVFHWAVSEPGREHFGYEEIDGGGAA